MNAHSAQTLFSFLSTNPKTATKQTEKFSRKAGKPRAAGVKAAQKLSTFNAGAQASDRRAVHIEYLGEGGFMELKSNQPPKKMIDYGMQDLSSYAAKNRWYFAEISDGLLDGAYDDEFLGDYIVDYGDVLRWAVDVLGCSETARAMLDEVCTKDWSVSFEDLNGSAYCIDVEQRHLILHHFTMDAVSLASSAFRREAVLMNLIKAMRDIWQEKRHGGFDRHYSPDYILLMERLRMADLDVLAILCAWEMRAEGYPELWRHMIGSDIGDMAMIYSGHVERDESTAVSGQALCAVFKQWFRDAQRKKVCDHDTLEYMDDVLQYAEEQNPFGKRRPSKMNVEMLSCLPDRSAYLQGQGQDILSDPAYASVDDPINQSHLMHLVYDLEAVVIEDVAFRDAALARKIFPEEN